MRIQLSEHFTYKKLLAFVMPSITMMVFLNVYTIVDGLFVSNFVGESAVAAINLIWPLLMIFGAIGFMLGAGGSALVSKTLGEGDKKRANEYFSMLVYITLTIGVVIAVAGQFVIPYIATFFGAEGKMHEMCVLYGRILLGAQPLFILQNIFQSFFVTAEKPKLGLMVTAASGVVNMALDALFVAGFKWGLAGAAYATAASQLFGGAFPLIYFACKNSSLLRLTKTKFYGRAFLKSCTNGTSEFLSNIASAVVIILYNFQLQRLVEGDGGVAAYGAIGYIMMIFFSVFMGYGVGVTPVIAYNYGAGDREELKNLYKKSLVLMGVTGVLMTALSEALAYPLVLVFGYSGALFDMTLHGFRLYSVAFCLAGYNVFASSMFTGLNNGLISGVISFLRTLVFQAAAVLILPILWGLDGVWLATACAEVLSLAVSVSFLLAFGKKYGYTLRKTLKTI